MAQQYQAYSKPTYGGTPTPPSYPHSPESYPAQHPHQNTFAPPPQQHNMSDMKQPNVAYQPQQPMSDKPHAAAPGHSHGKVQSKFGPQWTFGMFDCCSPFSTCLLGCCCPCFLFGKTYAREHGDGESSGCGGMCCLWYCAAMFGFNSCLQCVMRGQQREKHGIEGSGFSDCCASFWCGCCTLIQEEKESIVRITGMDPKTKVAYQPLDQGMHYPA